MSDERIEAVRAHEKLGRGSCSVIDECYSDAELLCALDEEEVETPEQAIEWGFRVCQLDAEAALNCRWGEDDDEQLRSEFL